MKQEKLTLEDWALFVNNFTHANGYEYEKAGKDEQGVFRLPCFANPNHNDKVTIYERILLLDTTYSTNLCMDKGGVIETFANFIYEKRKEFERLGKGQLNTDEIVLLVHGLASANGNKRRAFSFATKYCAHINGNLCPIYDTIVAKCLGMWRRRFGDVKTNRAKGNYKNPMNYGGYIELYKRFQAECSQDLTFRQIDKILWWGGKVREGNEELVARVNEVIGR